MIIPLKNYQIEVIAKVLNYQTSFQKGRPKMRFLKLLNEKQEVFTKSRTEMLDSFAEKDEEGKAKMKNAVTPEGKLTLQYDLTAENLEKFNKEFEILLKEDCPLDLPESMKTDLTVVKNLMNESPASLTNQEIVILEQVLDAFDGKPVKEAAQAPEEPVVA